MKTLRALAAFIKRDLLIELSYRTSFVLQIGGILFSVLLWRFVTRVVDAPPSTPGLGGMDYFAYVLVGIAMYHYLSAALMSFSGKIRNEQVTGTLEAMLVTPTSIGTIVLGSSLWDFLLTSLKVVLYLLVGWIAFGVRIRPGGILPCVLILSLTVLAFSGIGILSAAFILYLKRGDPITYVIATVSALLGGVFYPPENLSPALEVCSRFLPITYALRALRGALLQGIPLAGLLPDLEALGIFVVVLVPLGVVAFRIAVRKARQEGSLVQY
ncbi:MAG TPA: ABC transporter permease [Candidatus Polarisedimenticolia bacterium]|nr:ABC transporter permease [Candidatus Polarisedimenticolia bacterium]